MPTPEWREEKATYVVRSLCRALASGEMSDAVREDIAGEALWNALKLLADAIGERLGSTRWSPGLVRLFRETPQQCDMWIELMMEPDFSAEDYWKKTG